MTALPSLKQLEYFVALADNRHFGRAAQSVGIAQPSLSVQISNLEDVLKQQLYERGRGPFRLTPAGREIVTRAKEAIAHVQGIVDYSASLQSGVAGTIRLGTSPTLGPYLLPHVVGQLHRDHPDLSLYIREAAPRDLLSELGAGTHDVILTQLPVSGSDFIVERLFREPMALAVAVDHPLAKKKTVSDADLAGLTVLSLGPAYALHEQISGICRDFGATLQRSYEGTSLDALRQMVGMGMGATFLPMLYVRSEVGSKETAIAVRQFRISKFVRSIGLVWRRSTGKSKGIEHLSAALRSVARTEFADVTTVERP